MIPRVIYQHRSFPQAKNLLPVQKSLNPTVGWLNAKTECKSAFVDTNTKKKLSTAKLRSYSIKMQAAAKRPALRGKELAAPRCSENFSLRDYITSKHHHIFGLRVL